jgi:hypothetical protein
MPQGVRTIGVFDSGVGGLSVLHHIRATLPDAHLIYVADSGHVPYGDKSPAYIEARSQALTRFLLQQGAQAIVIACNTATAAAAGLVVRSDDGQVLIDLDGDGHEQTGWVLFYLHIASLERVAEGKQLALGDLVGHPSCEGGELTGTHVHIARKYNGEWILADGPLAFNLSGWQVHNGARAYDGALTRFSRTVIASTSSEGKSAIRADE